MSTKTRSKRRKSSSKNGQRVVLQQPNGVLHPRAQKVGPEHFGVVSVDVAKVRSKWMLSDFYGNVIIEPTHVEHGKTGFQNAIECLRRNVSSQELDALVAEVLLDGSRIVSVVCELVASRMTKHVRVNRELELGNFSCSGNHLGPVVAKVSWAAI